MLIGGGTLGHDPDTVTGNLVGSYEVVDVFTVLTGRGDELEVDCHTHLLLEELVCPVGVELDGSGCLAE